MRSLVVVVVGPWLEVFVSLFGVGPVLGVGLFAQGGLDKAFGFSVGSWGIGPSKAVFELHLLAGEPEQAGAVARTVVSNQESPGKQQGLSHLIH
jgi:hypothetical protein